MQYGSNLYYIDDQLPIVKWPEDQCCGADKCDILMDKITLPPKKYPGGICMINLEIEIYLVLKNISIRSDTFIWF